MLYIVSGILLVSALIRIIGDHKRRQAERRRGAEIARLTAEFKLQKAEAEMWAKRQAAVEREQMRQEKEQERLAREQERERKEREAADAKLAKEQEKQKERLMKLEQRMATAESEIAFNREQRDRLFKLLDIEEMERDASIPGGKEWQKHQRKVISLESQIHTVQKRIDKAHMDKAFCEKQMSA